MPSLVSPLASKHPLEPGGKRHDRECCCPKHTDVYPNAIPELVHANSRAGCRDVASLDDLDAAVGRSLGRGARGQARSVFLADGVEGAEAVVGAVGLNFQVAGDCPAFRPVAKDHPVFGAFEGSTAAWLVVPCFLSCGSLFRGSRGIV